MTDIDIHEPATAPSGPTRPGKTEWLANLKKIGTEHGFFERIGQRHSALHVREGDILLVTFDEAERVYADTADGLPSGFESVRKRDWSLLNIMTTKQSWFREETLFAFFDRLVDDGFFDEFDQVIFQGFGPMCGYAACAYSVVCPGAEVIATSPAASLDRDDVPFELRFRNQRRSDFQTRYGYAPAMTEAAANVSIIYDPFDTLGAAHAAQFRGPHVGHYRLRWGGPDLHEIFAHSSVTTRILRMISGKKISAARLAHLIRDARRADPAYLTRVANHAMATGHPRRAMTVLRHAAKVTGDARFAEQADALAGATA